MQPEPVIKMSTREWQRERLGPSAKRETKWAQVNMYQIGLSMRALTKTMQLVKYQFIKVANSIFIPDESSS